MTGQFFPRGKNGPAHSFPGEKTDWGKNDRYTASQTMMTQKDSKLPQMICSEVASLSSMHNWISVM